MSENRINIEQADNGWTVTVYKENDKKGEEMMYQEPERLVATSKEEVMKIVEDNI